MLILFGSFVLASGGLLIMTMKRMILVPISRLSDALARVAQNGHSERTIRIAGANEVQDLADQVNEMLVRIRRSESDLIRTERLRVAGELSAGVSHNLNNILTGILGPSEYLEQKLGDPEELAEARRIHRAAVRAKDLVSRFSQAVRHGTPVRSRAVEINGVIRLAIEASRP
jgi:signal transduction histidine kinase